MQPHADAPTGRRNVPSVGPTKGPPAAVPAQRRVEPEVPPDAEVPDALPDDAGVLDAVPEDLHDSPGGVSVPSGVSAPARPALTERERDILTFERQWWRHAGAKEQAIRDTFDLSATRYYQLLNGLLDNPTALAVDPVLVGRLRRLRSTRARIRRR